MFSLIASLGVLCFGWIHSNSRQPWLSLLAHSPFKVAHGELVMRCFFLNYWCLVSMHLKTLTYWRVGASMSLISQDMTTIRTLYLIFKTLPVVFSLKIANWSYSVLDIARFSGAENLLCHMEATGLDPGTMQFGSRANRWATNAAATQKPEMIFAVVNHWACRLAVMPPRAPPICSTTDTSPKRNTYNSKPNGVGACFPQPMRLCKSVCIKSATKKQQARLNHSVYATTSDKRCRSQYQVRMGRGMWTNFLQR